MFVLDEVDKLGADWRGDPSSALLEVLDPEQNDSFRDHYLDLAFDLSRSDVHCHRQRAGHDPASAAGPDGDDQSGRIHARRSCTSPRRYLVPRQINANGLTASQIEFADPALAEIIDEYTREAGVRGLER